MLRSVRSKLRPPPRTLSNLKISLRLAKGPELAGFDVGVSVSAETFSGLEAILGQLSLGGGIPFPGSTNAKLAMATVLPSIQPSSRVRLPSHR